MKQPIRALLLLGVLASILLGACTLPVRNYPDFNAFVFHPNNGAILMLGAAYDVRANAVSDLAEITRMAFYANGRLIGESAALDCSGRNCQGGVSWTPPAIGEYFLQAEVNRGRGARASIFSEAVRVCVIDFDIWPQQAGLNFESEGYTGLCDLPNRDEFAVPGEITLDVVARPSPLSFVPGNIPCPPRPTLLSFEASVHDPPEDVVFVTVELSIPVVASPGESFLHLLVLTRTGVAPGPTILYTGGIELGEDLREALQEASGRAVSAELTWTARALGRGGEILLQRGPFTLPADPVMCDGSSIAPAASTPTLVTVPTFTPTPGSAKDCPAGTYFAETTHRCIAIQIKTPRSGGGGPNCSQYGNASACTAAGCVWNGQMLSCQ